MEEVEVKLDAFRKSLKEPMKKCRELSAHFETESQNGDIGTEKMQKLCSPHYETVMNAKTTLEKLVLQMDVYMISIREEKGRHHKDDKADSGFVKSTDSAVLDIAKPPVQETENQQTAKTAVEYDDEDDDSPILEDENDSKY